MGYLSQLDRPASVDEDIQMHADSLYQRMLEQEQAQEAAKAAGLPIPEFQPVIPKAPASPSNFNRDSQQPAEAAASKTVAEAVAGAERKAPQRDYLTHKARAELEKRKKDQPEYVRELEENAMRAEAESDIEVAKEMGRLRNERVRAREERRKNGEATLGDTVSGWLGW